MVRALACHSEIGVACSIPGRFIIFKLGLPPSQDENAGGLELAGHLENKTPLNLNVTLNLNAPLNLLLGTRDRIITACKY
jgi:hypothetical protein